MTLEMDQFHAGFFEEAFESLDAMENNLLQLDPGIPNAEAINSIFRVAHSIKGGSGMFSFNEITSFTHLSAGDVLLDELRAGRMPVTRPTIDLLLRNRPNLCCAACCRRRSARPPPDQQTVADVQFDLEQMLLQLSPRLRMLTCASHNRRMEA